MRREGEIIQFIPFSSFVDLAFWHEFGRRKLEKYKLSEEPIPLVGSYSSSRGSTGSGLATPAAMNVGLESFTEQHVPQYHCMAPGQAVNFNTHEAFQQFDSQAELQRCGQAVWRDIASGAALKDPSLLNRWFFLSYVDLKKFNYLSIFGFPALKFASPLKGICQPLSQRLSPALVQALSAALSALYALPDAPHHTCVLLKPGSSPAAAEPILIEPDLSRFRDFFGPSDVPTVAFLDPSSSPQHPGWPLRNLLALISHHFGPIPRLDAIAVRTTSAIADLSPSVLFQIHDVPDSSAQDWLSPATLTVTGWERDSRGKTAPKMLRLGKMLDPAQLASSSVALNLSLMRWRIMPSLNLERIALSRVLIIGAGTLGCNVARVLLGWGVQRFAFVDSGKVSHSNPARQSLYTFDDAKRSRNKASAAAENLRAVVPTVQADGHVLSIPMPGHPVSDAERPKTALAVEQLTALIQEADVVFLLTDSRESRWLPSMLCAAFNKLCIDAALGFDTFVVMRHGVRPLTSSQPGPSTSSASATVASSSSSSSSTVSSLATDQPVHLGCYFCNDVVAPQDSLTNRTLDQQCTVTRPGISVLASSLACELFVTILQHPLGGCAPADGNQPPSQETSQPLGLVPHQIRGYLTHFSNLLITGYAFDRCTACSKHIIDAYLAAGFDFILSVLNNPKILEDTSKLTELQAESLDMSGGFEEFDEFDD